MSQEQPQRPKTDPESIKYGDVFQVSGDVASKPIAPQDAATMQAAENVVLGKTQKGGTASVMQSAADYNERAGLVGHDESNVTKDQGITITDEIVKGKRVVTETVGGQVVGQYVQPEVPTTTPAGPLDRDAITIGEALEATALSAGDRPIDQSDAAAIQAAEARATGHETTPGGIGAKAQSAATANARTLGYEQKTKLSDVLADAKTALTDDKPVTGQDAERVIGAELRNKLDMSSTPGGVAETIAEAARLNQQNK